MLVASTRPVSARPAEQRLRLSVRSARADGSLSTRRTLRTATRIRSVEAAANANGDAAVAWFEDRGVRSDRVYVALRRRGHAFGAPRRLATGRVRSVAVAVGASGDVLVAWDARGEIGTRFRPRGRASFRAADRIRSGPAFFGRPAPGRHPQRPRGARLERAVRQRGRRERPAALRGRGAPVRRPSLPPGAPARAPGGRAGAADDRRRRGRHGADRGRLDGLRRRHAAREGRAVRPRVCASRRRRRCRRRARRPCSATSPRTRAAACSRSGTTARSPRTRSGPRLATGGGAAFGAPEAVSPAQEARDGHAAFDPITHEPTVVWSNRPAGSDRPIRTFAQAATRTP